MFAAVAAALLAPPMVVCSYNIRFATANDGENRWERRGPSLIDWVSTLRPDVLGLQEALSSQIDELLEAMPNHAAIGVGRNDALLAGEFAPILYDSRRFNVAASGTFWLSDTPEIVASATWGNTIPRICTWARLIDRSGHGFYVFNTHYDHISQKSRERSTELILSKIETRAYDEPVIVTGDFNAGEENPAITAWSDAGFVSSFRQLHPDAREVGTFTGFDASANSGAKIDYVFVDGAWDVLESRIDRTTWDDGRPLSDHWPIVSRVQVRATP